MTTVTTVPVSSVTTTPATTGGWIAFANGARVLVIAPTSAHAGVPELWDALGAVDGLQRTLDLITSKGLSATPPFALLDFTAALRVIVRGDVTVEVTGPGGGESLDGTGVSTWIERSIDGATAAAVTVVGAVAADVPALPLLAGAAWVASLTVAEISGLGQLPVAEPVEAPAAIAPAASTGSPVADAAPTGSNRVVEAATPVEPAAPVEPVEAGAPVEPVEIDIEATVTEAPSAAPEPEQPTVAIDNLETSPEGYDYLFGDTMYRSVADAAVRDDEPEADDAAPAVEADGAAANEEAGGDHDGHTVLTSDIAKLRGRRKPKTAADAPPVAPPVVVVSLVLADGTRELLSQPILVGRAPSVSQVSGGKMPKLITVGGADQDISRTHVRFVLEGGTVVVTDLHSRNGTTIAMPGKDPQKLRAGEPTAVIVGTVVDLGGGVTFTVDEA